MTGYPDPATIANANFSVSLLEKQNGPTFNVDAHVIRTSDMATVLASDYETNAQLLMSDFTTNATAIGNIGLNTSGQSELTTWLQSNPLILPDPGTMGSQNIYYRYGPNTSGWTPGKTDAQLTISDNTASPYDLWATANGAGAMDEDDDKDGLVNLTEYALGGNPTSEDDSDLLPTQVETVDGLTYVFRRRVDPAAAGLSYTVETSTTLASGQWTETETDEIGENGIDTEFVSVVNSVDTTGKPRLFIRLKIEAQ
jgi:hypothetical protein